MLLTMFNRYWFNLCIRFKIALTETVKYIFTWERLEGDMIFEVLVFPVFQKNFVYLYLFLNTLYVKRYLSSLNMYNYLHKSFVMLLHPYTTRATTKKRKYSQNGTIRVAGDLPVLLTRRLRTKNIFNRCPIFLPPFKCEE